MAGTRAYLRTFDVYGTFEEQVGVLKKIGNPQVTIGFSMFSILNGLMTWMIWGASPFWETYI
jgi:hypothetical protein